MDNKKKEISERRQAMRVLGQMSQLGLTAVFCVAIGVVLGIWLDRFFDTAPVFIIIFSLLGCAASIKTMMDVAKKFK